MEETSSQFMSLCSLGEPPMYLPWEIMQEIFRYLDGKTLIICKRVCRTWKGHIDYLEQKITFWYSICQKEIPTHSRFDLLDNIFPRNWENKSCIDWQIIYKSWYKWHNLQGSPATVKKVVSGFNGISSIKISGEWLLISTCEGRGKLTAVNLLSYKTIDVYLCGGAILNFELVYSDIQCVPNITPKKELEDIFSTLEHNEIWLELDTCYIQLGKTFCNFLDKYHQKIRHSRGYKARLVTQGVSSDLYLNKICSKVSGPEEVKVVLENTYSVLLDFWLNKICLSNLVKNYGTPVTVTIDTVTFDTKSQATIDKRRHYTVGSPNETWNVHSWHALFCIALSNTECLIFNTANVSDQYIPAKKGYITTGLFYTKFLFLGSDRGQLVIYELEHLKHCETPVCVKGSWKIIQVSNSKIIHIAVAEPIHHKGRNPMIVCTSPEDVYFVTFGEFSLEK